jgi:hypothetical protein
VKKWFLLLSLVSTLSFADIGSVTEATGVAIIKRGSNTISISKGTTVETNDRVETKNGEVKITFKDNTTVKVTPSSALLIDDFVYDPKSNAGKLGLKAAEGTVRYVSGNIAHNNPNAVNIKTPTAAIAVRGTDFIMSSDEAGRSIVILMPTCEENVQIVNLKGLICGSGAIDVESGGHIIHMNQPYQAVITETEGDAPVGPVVVNLSNTPVGNNLHLNPPQTMSGERITQLAKAAAEKTGDAKKDNTKQTLNDSINTGQSTEATASVVQQQEAQAKQEIADQQAADAQAAKAIQKASTEEDALVAAGVTINSSPAVDPNVFGVYHDNNPALNQIGWGYGSLSQNGHNYANVSLPLNSQVLVVVTQDRQTDAYNFAGGNNKPQGSITITQTYNTK